MNTKVIFLLLVFFMPLTCESADRDLYTNLRKSIKVKNPDQLTRLVFSESTCPLNADEVIKITDGVLIRSRIKPISFFEAPDFGLYLKLSLECIKLENNYYVFNASVHFADNSGITTVLYDHNFGNYGTTNKHYLQQELRSYVEDAVTQYVKANFDL